jgi:hypothetical protein
MQPGFNLSSKIIRQLPSLLTLTPPLPRAPIGACEISEACDGPTAML